MAGLLDLISAPTPGRARGLLSDLVAPAQNRLRGLLSDPSGFLRAALSDVVPTDQQAQEQLARYRMPASQDYAMGPSWYDNKMRDIALAGMALKSGANPIFKEELVGHHNGQTDNILRALIGDNPAGRIEYSVYGGKPSIGMIRTEPAYQRQGIATEMLRNLQSKYPNQMIDWGMLTDDGAKLYQSVPKRQVPSEYAAQFARLDAAIKERDKLMRIADKFQASKNPTQAQRQAMGKVTEPLNSLHDEIDALESALYGKPKSITLID